MTMLLLAETVIDGVHDRPLTDHGVLIEEGEIARVGAQEAFQAEDAETVRDLGNATIVPGLINAHEHLIFREAAGHPLDFLEHSSHNDLALRAVRTAVDALASGFTSVRDMGTMYGLSVFVRDAVECGQLAGPRVVACNQPLCRTGGHADVISMSVDGPDAVRRGVRTQVSAGANFIKLMASDDPVAVPGEEHSRPGFSTREVEAAVEEAERQRVPVGCHCMGAEALAQVIEAGVDVVDHGIYLTDELAERMAMSGIGLTPTYSSYSYQTFSDAYDRGADWNRRHRPLAEAQPKSVAAAIDAGVTLLNGTDSVGRYAQEVELFREAGLGRMESLHTCWRNPARMLGIDGVTGTLESGTCADLVVLAEDPYEDPYALETVELVIKEGDVFDPDALRAGFALL